MAAAQARARRVHVIFQGLDADRDGFLALEELRQFAKLMEYAGSDEDWVREYSTLAMRVSADPAAGLSEMEFASLLATSDCNCFCTDGEVAALAVEVQAGGRSDGTQSPGPAVLRAELILDLFSGLDLNRNGRLHGHELAAYAVLCGFQAAEEEQWDEYPSLCQHYGWDADLGVSARQFEAFVNDGDCPIQVSTYELLSFVRRLRPGYVKRSCISRADLLGFVFRGFLSPPRSRLTSQDMHCFAGFVGYDGEGGPAWDAEFDAMCSHYGWEGGAVTEAQWAEVVNEEGAPCYCSEVELRWVLAQLQLMGRLPCVSQEFQEELQRAAALGVAAPGPVPAARARTGGASPREERAESPVRGGGHGTKATQRTADATPLQQLADERPPSPRNRSAPTASDEIPQRQPAVQRSPTPDWPASRETDSDAEAEAASEPQQVPRSRASRALQGDAEERRRLVDEQNEEMDAAAKLFGEVTQYMREVPPPPIEDSKERQLQIVQERAQRAAEQQRPAFLPQQPNDALPDLEPKYKAPARHRNFLAALSLGEDEEACHTIKSADAKQLNLRDVRGCTALHVVAQKGLPLAIAALLDRGSFESPGAVDHGGWNALHHAVKHNQASACAALLVNPRFLGADDASQNAWGWTALHRAAFHGHLDIVLLLLSSKQFGAVNAKDKVGRTALHTAASQAHVEASLAIARSPRFTQVDATDRYGRKAISLAIGGYPIGGFPLWQPEAVSRDRAETESASKKMGNKPRGRAVTAALGGYPPCQPEGDRRYRAMTEPTSKMESPPRGRGRLATERAGGAPWQPEGDGRARTAAESAPRARTATEATSRGRAATTPTSKEVEEQPRGVDMHFDEHDAWEELNCLASFVGEKFLSLRDAFSRMDMNHSRKIVRIELQAALQNAGYRGNIGVLWHSLDLDRDGYVGIEEFMHMMRPFASAWDKARASMDARSRANGPPFSGQRMSFAASRDS